MKDFFKVGLIVADDAEFAPISEHCLNHGGEEISLLGRPAVRYSVSNEARTVEVIAVYCGIGKVNAATLTTYIAATECVDLIVNCGLSGGLQNVSVGEVVVGTGFVEHDFDLTAIGYKPGEKPGQEYFYKADEYFINDFKSKYQCKSGVMVSGDCFVSDDAKAAALIKDWNAVSCDMESAAIASVCHGFNLPFISIRRISDGADSGAGSTYKTTVMDKQTWMTVSIKWIESLLNCTDF